MEKGREIPLNLNVYKAQFRRDPTTLTRMATERLIALSRFQVMVALGGTVIGTVVAQTVFVVYEQRPTSNERREE